MTVLAPVAAYRLWSSSYDNDTNPLLALEERILKPRVGFSPGMRMLDLATGTGRWLECALHCGANAFGIDLSADMLVRAMAKGMAGRVVQGSITALPFADAFADVAISSFALGYVASIEAAFREMARTARRSIVSDLHPDAVRSGWTRSFRSAGVRYEVASYAHSMESMDDCARASRLRLMWRVEESFGEPERRIFERAGKGDSFEPAQTARALLISCWERV